MKTFKETEFVEENEKVNKKKFAIEWQKLSRCKEKVLDKLMNKKTGEEKKDIQIPGKNDNDLFVNKDPLENYKDPSSYSAFKGFENKPKSKLPQSQAYLSSTHSSKFPSTHLNLVSPLTLKN